MDMYVHTPQHVHKQSAVAQFGLYLMLKYYGRPSCFAQKNKRSGRGAMVIDVLSVEGTFNLVS